MCACIYKFYKGYVVPFLKGVALLGAIGFVSIPPLCVFVTSPNIQSAALMMGAGLLIAILSRLNRIVEFSGFGISAKLENTIKEAHATIDQVKELALILAKSSLSNTARSGWLGGLTSDQKREFLQETVKALKSVGLSESQISEATKDYHNCVLRNYGLAILGQHTTPDTGNNDLRHEWEQLRECAIDTPHTANVLRAFLEKYGLMNDDIDRRLKDYEHYYNHHDFRDYEDYKNRDKWPERLIDPAKTQR